MSWGVALRSLRLRSAMLGGAGAILLASCFPAAAPPPPILRFSVFGCTGAPQFWQAPPDVHSAVFDLYGAQGGSYTSAGQATGGLGGETKTTHALVPGQLLEIDVGCKGADTVAGVPGATSPGGLGGASGGPGGDGGTAVFPGAGGGGASGVVLNVFAPMIFPDFIAGGGGGAGGSAGPSVPLQAGGGGVGGGGPSAPAAVGGDSGVSSCVKGGAPGSDFIFGNGGVASSCSPSAGLDGSAGNLFDGGPGASNTTNTVSGQGGGGGGGGWWGGGGGASGPALGGAGGGGGASGTCGPGVCLAQASGVRAGDGLIILYYVSSFAASAANTSTASHASAGFRPWHHP